MARKYNRYGILMVSTLLASLSFTGCKTGKVASSDSGYKYEYSQPISKPVTDKSTANALVKEARRWIGTKYSYGGHSLKGTDCSGMVMEVYLKVCNIKLPRNSAQQQQYCKSVKRKDLKTGDLVFFATGKNKKRVSHVGMYIGDGEMIHASSSRGVIISRLNEKYYERTYHSSGRVIAMPDVKIDKKSTDFIPKAKTVTESTKPDTNISVDVKTLDDLLDQKIDSIYSK